MGRRKSSGAGCIGGLVVLGGCVWLFEHHPAVAVTAAIIVVLLVVFSGPGTCDVCGSGLKKVSHTWKIDGKKVTACPQCNQNIQRRKSKQAVEDLLD